MWKSGAVPIPLMKDNGVPLVMKAAVVPSVDTFSTSCPEFPAIEL